MHTHAIVNGNDLNQTGSSDSSSIAPLQRGMLLVDTAIIILPDRLMTTLS